MLRSILVGLDGTADSEAAAELALRWAGRAEALLVGLTVVDEPGVHGVEEVLAGQAYFEKLNDELIAETRQRLAEVSGRLAARAAEAGVAFRAVDVVGSPCEAMLRESQRYDLVVLGRRTHFRFGCSEGSPDDTLDAVLRGCPRPVVMVPGVVPAGEAVVVATDGSVSAARSLGSLADSGLARGKPVHVVCLSSDGAEAAEAVGRAVDFLTLHDIRATAHPILSDEAPAGAILEAMRAWEPGLLVVGAHGRSSIAEYFLGSNTLTFVQNSPVPVFLDR